MSKTGKMGRPRGFDEDAALDAAMRVFWAKGYEGATSTDLTQAMGINASSMYAAFMNKETLFELAFARYTKEQLAYVPEALQLSSFEDTVKALIGGTVDLVSAPGNPGGCLTVQGALAVGTNAEPIRDLLSEFRRKGEAVLKQRVERAKRDGELDASINAGDFARYISTLMTGLAVQSANGASKAELRRDADLAVSHLGY